MTEGYSKETTNVVPGTIFGIRAFQAITSRTNRHNYTIGSLTAVSATKYVWLDGKNTATCMPINDDDTPSHDDEVCPLINCHCGFYSRTDGYNEFMVEWCDCQTCKYNNFPVAGVIEAWGKVIVGSKGFRAQYAKIVAIATPYAAGGFKHLPRTEYRDLLDNMRKIYPSTQWFHSEADMAAAYNLTLHSLRIPELEGDSL